MRPDARRVLDLRIWRHTEAWPVRHGFTRANDDHLNTLRIGALVLCFHWQRENVETGDRA